ncbi:unnamed protein product, partial [Trichogramma brassicae]
HTLVPLHPLPGPAHRRQAKVRPPPPNSQRKGSRCDRCPCEDHAQLWRAQKQPTQAVCSRRRLRTPVRSPRLEHSSTNVSLHTTGGVNPPTSLPACDRRPAACRLRGHICPCRHTTTGPSRGRVSAALRPPPRGRKGRGTLGNAKQVAGSMGPVEEGPMDAPTDPKYQTSSATTTPGRSNCTSRHHGRTSRSMQEDQGPHCAWARRSTKLRYQDRHFQAPSKWQDRKKKFNTTGVSLKFSRALLKLIDTLRWRAITIKKNTRNDNIMKIADNFIRASLKNKICLTSVISSHSLDSPWPLACDSCPKLRPTTESAHPDGCYTISDCSTCPHLLLSIQVGHEIHHRPLIDACLLGIASSLDSSDPAHLGVQHQVKNLHGLLKKTNNAFFRPCRIFSFTGTIQTSIGACKARSHCKEKRGYAHNMCRLKSYSAPLSLPAAQSADEGINITLFFVLLQMFSLVLRSVVALRGVEGVGSERSGVITLLICPPPFAALGGRGRSSRNGALFKRGTCATIPPASFRERILTTRRIIQGVWRPYLEPWCSFWSAEVSFCQTGRRCPAARRQGREVERMNEQELRAEVAA